MKLIFTAIANDDKRGEDFLNRTARDRYDDCRRACVNSLETSMLDVRSTD